jgi:hypothetical protein
VEGTFLARLGSGCDRRHIVENPLDPNSDRLLIQLQGGGWSPLDWSPDDSKILAIQEISISESYLWLVDVKVGKKY